MTKTLKEGDKAPAFSLPTDGGGKIDDLPPVTIVFEIGEGVGGAGAQIGFFT